MEEESLEFDLPLCESLGEFLTKSDEERIAEIELERSLQKNNEIVDDPRDVTELVAIIDADKKNNHWSAPPESKNYPGDYNFSVDCSSITENISAYSAAREKLYVLRDSPCAFTFRTSSPAPINSYLRVMSIFVDAEHTNFDVHRCLNHALQDFNNGIGAVDHVIRCDNHPGKFVRNTDTLRRSLILPYNAHNRGQLHSIQILRFMCLTSCIGGMNRRPIRVIFTLENSGVVIGRCSLGVKICSSPLRDLKKDDAKPALVSVMPPVLRSVSLFSLKDMESEVKEQNPHMLHNLPSPAKKTCLDSKEKKKKDNYSKISVPSSGITYVIKAQDREEYKLLMMAKSFYEFSQFIKHLELPEQLLKHKKPKKKCYKN